MTEYLILALSYPANVRRFAHGAYSARAPGAGSYWPESLLITLLYMGGVWLMFSQV